MRRLHLFILFLILLLGLFFRLYQTVERLEFAHDGDLYSWIVKDMVIDHHFRLIGQLTSAPGIFIGALFYYLLIPFFLLSKMDPAGVIFVPAIMGSLTILSYFFVLSRLFKIEVGLIAAFLYAILISTVNFDRWVVPTMTTSLWSIWYLYIVIMLGRGNFSVLPILGILIGLIWHIHLALIPALIAIPVAIWQSHKLPKRKEIFLFLITLLFTSLPLILFETRHNFSQTQSLISNFSIKYSQESGVTKFLWVFEKISKNINSLLISPQSLPEFTKIPFSLIILFSGFFLLKIKLLKFVELITLYSWILGVVIFFTLTSSPISEYYFSNLEVIFLTFVSLYLYLLFKSSKIGRIILFTFLLVILIKNLFFFITYKPYHKGYVERKSVVDYINRDSKNKGYQCIAINYITAPGENVGFRYLFYLQDIHLIPPSKEIPVYNIVIPDELSLGEVKQKFGHIGIIPPTSIPEKEVIKKSCETPNTNLTDPMFGYVD